MCRRSFTAPRFPLRLLAVAALALCLVSAALPPEPSGISVGRMKFCRAIKDREPHQPAAKFPSDIEKVYCFTVILNAGEETHVVHRWYRKEKLMAEVKLTARGEYWRTWSSKRMLPEWAGGWRVDVAAADGRTLKSLSFELVAAGTDAGPKGQAGDGEGEAGEGE